MDGVAEPRAEASYWLTITFSQTLGLADARHSAGRLGGDSGPGYAAGALIFGALLGVLVVLTTTTSISRVALFWAFILTRPLAATVGDFLDKPIANGRLEFSHRLASAVLAVIILVLLVLLPQGAGRHSRSPDV